MEGMNGPRSGLVGVGGDQPTRVSGADVAGFAYESARAFIRLARHGARVELAKGSGNFGLGKK